MKKIEYMEIDDCSVKTLNGLGLEGWRPACLHKIPGHYDKPFDPNEWIDPKWSGLLYREVGR
jgi:hypothetical protein